jgi:hypothetical protein
VLNSSTYAKLNVLREQNKVGDSQITGGSGEFEGAGGSGTLLNMPGNEPGTRVGSYDGTIID